MRFGAGFGYGKNRRKQLAFEESFEKHVSKVQKPQYIRKEGNNGVRNPLFSAFANILRVMLFGDRGDDSKQSASPYTTKPKNPQQSHVRTERQINQSQTKRE